MYRKKTRKRREKIPFSQSSWPGWMDNSHPFEIGFFKYIIHIIFELSAASLKIWEWKFIRRFKRKNRTINEIKQILC